MPTTTGPFREAALAWYRRNRERTAALFECLAPSAYHAQPIALRHPLVFYEGHLPAFSLNTLVKKALGRRGVDEGLERLFARGIDPDESGGPSASSAWPARGRVRAFVREADARVEDALATAELDVPGHPFLEGADAVYTILEHEAMHHETLLYLLHHLPLDQKRAPADYRIATDGPDRRTGDAVRVPAGAAVLGAARGAIPFGWDNEYGRLETPVGAFEIDRDDVTNGSFAEFVGDGGYVRPELWEPRDWEWVQSRGLAHPPFWRREGGGWLWLGMFGVFPLPERWPVYVTLAEARAYARWRGRRLPTEPEYQRAAYGGGDGRPRPYPWGDASPTPAHGVFDFSSWEPHPVGTHPAGCSAFGAEDLVGNGWEWTSSPFGPLPGFAPRASYPEYSADFFDGEHYVMKGASPATARELLRPTFRNWFRARYPYVYATFRTAREES